MPEENVTVELNNDHKQEEQILDETEQPLVIDIKEPDPTPIEVKDSPKEVIEVEKEPDVEMTDVQLVEKSEKEKVVQPINGDVTKVKQFV